MGGQTRRIWERYNEMAQNGCLIRIKTKMTEMMEAKAMTTEEAAEEEAAVVPWRISYHDGSANSFLFRAFNAFLIWFR